MDWKGLNDEFGWFVWGLLGIGLIWFFMGGLASPTAHEGQFIKPLAPVGSGDVYGNYYPGEPTNRKQELDLPEAPSKLIRIITWPLRALVD